MAGADGDSDEIELFRPIRSSPLMYSGAPSYGSSSIASSNNDLQSLLTFASNLNVLRDFCSDPSLMQRLKIRSYVLDHITNPAKTLARTDLDMPIVDLLRLINESVDISKAFSVDLLCWYLGAGTFDCQAANNEIWDPIRYYGILLPKSSIVSSLEFHLSHSVDVPTFVTWPGELLVEQSSSSYGLGSTTMTMTLGPSIHGTFANYKLLYAVVVGVGCVYVDWRTMTKPQCYIIGQKSLELTNKEQQWQCLITRWVLV